MPRPAHRTITFTIDGLEVQAPENAMLVDAAKHGDVEIPVFCYEPKLGNPVGACRMCLVEIEGIGKLQTGCSTPVKDGMVVHTQSDRVKVAQNSVVEFLLVNHPLDCPVCDKGGECPLQDITFGWGRGTSRFIEPKRHFVKPLALSPLIAIDRERCILCYRCARFSQEVSEDNQLVLLERGAHSYISTFDGHPYVAPFSGNIVELCPVGALTSQPYRFRARPWDIEDAGSVCTLCPAQCNVTFTVRDDRVLRVLAREHPGVDDGWLCDKGRFAYQAIHAEERITQPLIRDGGELRPVSWERALEHATAALERAAGKGAAPGADGAGPADAAGPGRTPGRVGALVGGDSTNEEGFLLQRLVREGLASEHIDTLAGADPGDLRRLADPALQATVADLEFAHTVLVVGVEPVREIPILDLRIRKGVRRHGVALAVAGPDPSTLDPNAKLSLRYDPGGDGAFLSALAAAADGGEQGDLENAARAAGADAEQIRALAELLTGGGEDVAILYGQRALLDGGADALLALAAKLNLKDRPGAGLLGVPAAGANGRGLLEAGVAPGYGPGYAPRAIGGGGANAEAAGAGNAGREGADDENAGREGAGAPGDCSAHAIGAALAAGELTALYLLHADPLRSELPRETWSAALERAGTVIAHASFLTEGIREHADVVFPAESYAEREGTIVHPDGRLQRLRPAIARPGAVRPGWSVIAELARRRGLDLGVLTGSMASQRLFDAVPFYAGLTLEEIGGRGVRWQERPRTSDVDALFSTAYDNGYTDFKKANTQSRPPADAGEDRAGDSGTDRSAGAGTDRAPSIWAAPEVEFSPALKFLHRRWGLAEGAR